MLEASIHTQVKDGVSCMPEWFNIFLSILHTSSKWTQLSAAVVSTAEAHLRLQKCINPTKIYAGIRTGQGTNKKNVNATLKKATKTQKNDSEYNKTKLQI